MFSPHEDPQAPPSERRDGPRFSVTSNALIRLSPTLTFRVQVRNLSLSAAQIVCEPRYALLVQLEPEAIPGKNSLIEISIALPGPHTSRGFTTACRALYREQLNEQQMILGLHFEPAARHSQQLLGEYLAALPSSRSARG